MAMRARLLPRVHRPHQLQEHYQQIQEISRQRTVTGKSSVLVTCPIIILTLPQALQPLAVGSIPRHRNCSLRRYLDRCLHLATPLSPQEGSSILPWHEAVRIRFSTFLGPWNGLRKPRHQRRRSASRWHTHSGPSPGPDRENGSELQEEVARPRSHINDIHIYLLFLRIS